jgi:hypothetical protein
MSLPDDMVRSAVSKACDFFGLPEVPVVNAAGTVTWPNDASTYDDDVLGFNREQLMKLGISGEDSLTLVYTHECAHRALQGARNDDWEEELACDFFAGVHAGLKGMNIANFEAALGSTQGGSSHPAGALRADFIEFGQQVAQDLTARHIEPTFQNCLDRFNQYLVSKGDLVSEYREHCDSTPSSPASALANESTVHVAGQPKGATQADLEYYEHQARITSGSEQEHWIKEAQWARNHLKSNLVSEDIHSASASSALADESTVHVTGQPKGATQADLEYYEHQARITSGSEQEHWIKEAQWARNHLKSN